MNRFYKFAGILTCAVALGLNLQWAVDGYGIKDGKAHSLVLAQDGTGTRTGTGNGNGQRYTKELGDCEAVFVIDADGYVVIFEKKVKVGGLGGTYTKKYIDVRVDCLAGGALVSCSECTCAKFWLGNC